MGERRVISASLSRRRAKRYYHQRKKRQDIEETPFRGLKENHFGSQQHLNLPNFPENSDLSSVGVGKVESGRQNRPSCVADQVIFRLLRGYLLAMALAMSVWTPKNAAQGPD